MPSLSGHVMSGAFEDRILAILRPQRVAGGACRHRWLLLPHAWGLPSSGRGPLSIGELQRAMLPRSCHHWRLPSQARSELRGLSIASRGKVYWDCGLHFSSWDSKWSQEKKAWCCAHYRGAHTVCKATVPWPPMLSGFAAQVHKVVHLCDAITSGGVPCNFPFTWSDRSILGL